MFDILQRASRNGSDEELKADTRQHRGGIGRRKETVNPRTWATVWWLAVGGMLEIRMDRHSVHRRLALLLGFVLVMTAILGWYTVARARSGVENLPVDKTKAVEKGADRSKEDLLIMLRPDDHIHRPARVVQLGWEITKGMRRPDGVLKTVYLINGLFPGPTIEARSGDTVIITVRNEIDGGEGLSLHWHGLRIANAMDGVDGVTQQPIEPGDAFTYQLDIPQDQSGTFWYHSHAETQRADGLYGAFVIHAPVKTREAGIAGSSSTYDTDDVLMVGDWYHRSSMDVLDYYRDWKNFKIEPVPDSLLLNGRGSFECTRAVPAWPVECQKAILPELRFSGQRTRLRIINTGASTGFSIAFAGHSASLLTVDGGNLVAHSAQGSGFGILYPGERVDLIVQRMESEESHITIALDRETMRFPNLALLATQQFPIATESSSVARLGHENKTASIVDLSRVSGVETAIPNKASATVLLYTTISYLAEFSNRPKGFINRTSWDTADLSATLLEMQETSWPLETAKSVQHIASNGMWVDVVLNNMDDKGHPFHLHGHDFYVLSRHYPSRRGVYESYNPFDSTYDQPGEGPNVLNPVKRDTIHVPSRGYVILRFKADNAGLWMFHCHVLWHQAVGMAMAFKIPPAGC
ncbi:hypothetical protein LTR78_009900 [Recurvomyces mirabilis]|uniref:Multicopper oxidase n=1 Tax=Recurvomyces mirabilis TaxID=574656 RepID=A0AAE0TMH4_9PEZI|nr:hypothetical protein LTR78_009900 [Recurvomyces mirabilis]KAK5150575.1 hypothetical protein LTS14_010069 [Recurvomyces mirabilis]